MVKVYACHGMANKLENSGSNHADISSSTSSDSILDEEPVTEETSFTESADGPPDMLSKLPDLSAGNWYTNNCFRRYWQHYNEVRKWCQKHYLVVKSLESQHLQNSFPFWPQYQNVKDLGKSSKSRRKKRARRKAKQRRREATPSDQSTVESMCVDDQAENVLEMEISEDMRDFFAQSERHRQQRDELKKLENEKGAEFKHINIEQVKHQIKAPTSEAPVERPGARRTVEMKLLYGKGAAMIHGMETALQMSFDRNMDIKQPPLWPNMPLKVIFS